MAVVQVLGLIGEILVVIKRIISPDNVDLSITHSRGSVAKESIALKINHEGKEIRLISKINYPRIQALPFCNNI